MTCFYYFDIALLFRQPYNKKRNIVTCIPNKMLTKSGDRVVILKIDLENKSNFEFCNMFLICCVTLNILKVNVRTHLRIFSASD